jgi:FeS assembly protein SufD
MPASCKKKPFKSIMNTLLNTYFSAVSHYVDEYQRLAKNLAAAHSEALQVMRKTALDNFVNQGFPTRKHPDWKYTALTPLLQIPFSILSTDHNKEPSLAASNNSRLVFINGYFTPSLSQLTSLPKSVCVKNLAAIITHEPAQLFKHWQADTAEKNSFINLNTAFIQDGAYIHLPADTQLPTPIELLFISTNEQCFIPIRNVIIAEKNSRAVIIEKYISITETTNCYFTNTVTECFLAAQSQLEHYKLITESEKSTHIGNLCVKQQKASQFSGYSIALNGGIVRSDSHIKLNDEQAECQLKGLYYAHGKQHIDQQTVIDHISPFTNSKEFYKGIIADQARAVFNGKVIVRPQAIKSKAEQLNKNLLLSPQAEINTKPQLEIFVDDIQCTHGASIGQLDETALFYLRARGISESEARKLLIKAFIHDILQQMPLLTTHPTLSDSLKTLLAYETV